MIPFKGNCEHGNRHDDCFRCLDRWANHMAWQRELDERAEVATMIAGMVSASDREYYAWIDEIAPRRTA